MVEKQMKISLKAVGSSQLCSSYPEFGCVSYTLKMPGLKKKLPPKAIHKFREAHKPFSTTVNTQTKQRDQSENDKTINIFDKKRKPNHKQALLKKKIQVSQLQEQKKIDAVFIPIVSSKSESFPQFHKWVDELGDWKRPLKKFIASQKMMSIYPSREKIFNAYKKTPWSDVKVVIIGQDPYNKPNQAMGLSFSILREQKVIPLTLKSIYKALEHDEKVKFESSRPLHGDLSSWAEQGVLLLNSCLTVRQGKYNSHKDCGWHEFTNATIDAISQEKEGIIFFLWGKFAKEKGKLINREKHHVLEFSHPSPILGSDFMNCKHFSEANDILLASKRQAIDWNLK